MANPNFFLQTSLQAGAGGVRRLAGRSREPNREELRLCGEETNQQAYQQVSFPDRVGCHVCRRLYQAEVY